MRLRRLAFELRVRRRRLDSITSSPDWPGKGPARHWESVRYDQLLVVAAAMLDLSPPGDLPLTPTARAVVEDALAMVGLDVFAPFGQSGDPFEDDDLVL
jgi:hypothetical protein